MNLLDLSSDNWVKIAENLASSDKKNLRTVSRMLKQKLDSRKRHLKVRPIGKRLTKENMESLTRMKTLLQHADVYFDLSDCDIHMVTSEELANIIRDIPVLTGLDLSFDSLSFNDIEAMRDANVDWSSLKVLNLRQTFCAADSTNALSDLLVSCTSLQNLYLAKIELEERGMRELASALGSSSSLTVLHLEENRLEDVGAMVLANELHRLPALTELNLSENKIQSAGMQTLARHLGDCSSLVALNVSNNEIRDDGATALAQAVKTHPCIQRLLSKQNELGPDGVQQIAQCTALTEMHLDENYVGDCVGTQEEENLFTDGLVRNNVIKVISMKFTFLVDQGAMKLAAGLQTCGHLRGLDLEENQISEIGAQSLAEALQHCSSLVVLKLSRNNLGDLGAMAIAKAMTNCKVLRYLWLQHNYIHAQAVKNVVHQMARHPSLRGLHVLRNFDVTPFMEETLKNDIRQKRKQISLF